ncbi:MAG: YciI family protein [Candidatus Bathyarchaeia archaeon]
MTEAEREVMQEHVLYWTGLADRGTAIVFGPVLDPKGTWGVAIVQVEDEAELRAILTNDPALSDGPQHSRPKMRTNYC